MQLIVFFLSLICLASCHRTGWTHRAEITRTYELNITSEIVNPDCHEESYPHLLVNGQFPAPPIRVTKNDNVHIIIRNHIDSKQSTTIHYHGIFQIGTNQADGVPGITQEPIQPGEEYHQQFQVINQAGTYHYHAHVGFGDDTVIGPFIVYDSEEAWPDDECENKKKLKDGPYEYDDERVVLLSEFWHMTDQDRMAYTLGTNYTGIALADSYLFNGRTVYDPSTTDSTCPGYSVFNVEPNSVYRFRFIGGVTAAVLSLNIYQHNFTIIEVDGNLVKPYNVSYLEVAPGQRISVLLHTLDANDGESFFINSIPRYINAASGNGRAILRYTTTCQKHQSAIATPADTAMSATDVTLLQLPAEKSQWFYPDLQPLDGEGVDISGPPDRTVVIRPSERLMPDNTTRWFLNERLYEESTHMPILTRIMEQSAEQRLSILNSSISAVDGYDSNLGAYVTAYNEIVDLVIETSTLSNGVCIGHPWHTHGMVHHTLASGLGEYIHERDKDLRTYQNPAFARDITFVYPEQILPPPLTPGDELCGWSKIRIQTTNPGAWAVHCHITTHMLQGMMMALVAAPDRIS
ncbi:hypothetical protein K492DRAFT_157014 [Lichtheimia hyalospora FSU 10163]|nr:hypothetical protein K492DRAFT_157014 [Lichtheimia hyalospora FSU 10163]